MTTPIIQPPPDPAFGELEVMRLLGAMLAHGDTDGVIHEGLRSALEIMKLDAGSVVLLPEDEDDIVGETEENLQTATSVGLSVEWLGSPVPLSRDRVFDRVVLQGEILVVENLAADPRVQIPDECVKENLGSLISGAMIFRGRPIGLIRLYARTPRAFSERDRQLLRAICQHAAIAVEQSRQIRLREQDLRIQRDLELAGDVQRRMMPRTLPRLPGLDLAARYIPSQSVGGDFYDAFEHDTGRLEIIVGDVVGHGIAAALLMASVRSAIRAFSDSGRRGVDEILGRANNALCRDTLASEFATVWYAHLDPATRRMVYCSAGHEPGLLFRGGLIARGEMDPGRVERLSVGGLVLGVEPTEWYQREAVQLEAGDLLVVATDGITEAINFQQERFGTPRLVRTICDLLGELPGASAKEVVEHIFWTLRQFTGLRGDADDRTMLTLRVEH